MSQQKARHNKHESCICIRIKFVLGLFICFCVSHFLWRRAFRLFSHCFLFCLWLLLFLSAAAASAPRCRLLSLSSSLLSLRVRRPAAGSPAEAPPLADGLIADWPIDFLCASTGRPPLHCTALRSLAGSHTTQARAIELQRSARTTASSVIGELRCDGSDGWRGD